MRTETKAGLALGAVLWFFSKGTKRKKNSSQELTVTPDTKGLYYGQLVSPEFAAKLSQVAAELGFEPNDLMTIIRIERGKGKKGLGSGVYHKYTDKSGTHKGNFSYGLFGILPATAKWLGTSPEAIYKMSDIEQIDLILDYFVKHGWNKGGEHDITNLPKFGEQEPGQLTQFDALYSGVWGGQTMIDADLDKVLLDEKTDPANYAKNKGADFDHDGQITKRDVLTIARQFRRAGGKEAS